MPTIGEDIRSLFKPVLVGLIVLAIASLAAWLWSWIVVGALTDALRGALADVRIESGNLKSIENSGRAEGWKCVDKEKEKRGQVNKYVMFDTPFENKPKVILALNDIDHIQGNNIRITAEVKGLKRENGSYRGFHYSFYTWCDTRIVKASASWIAYGR